jgi:hypothetical protein
VSAPAARVAQLEVLLGEKLLARLERSANFQLTPEQAEAFAQRLAVFAEVERSVLTRIRVALLDLAALRQRGAGSIARTTCIGSDYAKRYTCSTVEGALRFEAHGLELSAQALRPRAAALLEGRSTAELPSDQFIESLDSEANETRVTGESTVPYLSQLRASSVPAR